MCVPGLDPVTLGLLAASAGATAVGGAMNRREDEQNMRRQQAASNGALEQYLARQKVLSAENQAMLDQTTAKMTPEAQTQAQTEAVDTRNATIDKTVAQPSAEEIPISGSAPNVVKSTIASRMADAFKTATDNTKAAAKSRSYGDVLFGNDLNIGDTGRRMETTNSFSRAEAALLPSAQQFAQTAAYRPRSGIGDIIQGVGALGSMAAGSGIGGVRPGSPRFGFASPGQRA